MKSLYRSRRLTRRATVCAALTVCAAMLTPRVSAQWSSSGGNVFYNSGNVGVGMTNPQYTLDVNGTIHLTQGLYANAVYMEGGSTIFESSDTQNLYLSGNANMYMLIDNTYHAVINGNGMTINNGPTGAGAGVGLAVASGNVGIGTVNPQYPLSVNGTIQAKEVIVDTGWSDYVFDPNYRIRPLEQVAEYVKANRHLPDIPSEAEVTKNGVSLGEMQSKLLAKVEELTLQMIQLNDENKRLQVRVAELETAKGGK